MNPKLREFYVSSKKRPCLGGKSCEEVEILGLSLKCRNGFGGGSQGWW